MRKPLYLPGDLRYGKHPVDRHVLNRALGHSGIEGFVRVLHQRYAATIGYSHETGSAVIHRSGEDHPHDSPAVGFGGRPEEGVDGGAMAVFSGPAGQHNTAALDEHVTVRRCDVDSAGHELLSILHVRGMEFSASIEYRG